MNCRKTQKQTQSQLLFHLPTVQLIGVQKAGTSALADWLFDEGGYCRPKVFDNEPWYYSKETHFFDIDSRYNHGVSFYAKRFLNSGPRNMDATLDTLLFADRVRAIYDAAGGNQAIELKILVILREPVSRELSLYNHLAYDCRNLSSAERNDWHNQVLKNDGTIMSFDEFVDTVSIPGLKRVSGPGRSSRHGLYAKHLNNWFQLFGREQILILSYSELLKNAPKIQERVRMFLGHAIPGSICQSNSNDSRDKIKAPSSRAARSLLSIFGPENEKLYQLLRDKRGPPMEQRPYPEFESYSSNG
mgnify:CR=1 FL=1